MITDPTALTPVENHHGLWVKREDLHTGPYGVNGAKYRACRFLVEKASEAGYLEVISAASVLSPQSAMGSVLAADYGMGCTVIVGGTTPEKAILHKSIKIAHAAGADIRAIPVGYNPALQSAGKKMAEERGAWQLPYGITVPVGAPEQDIVDFLEVGAPQTANLPDDIETLILPFGSGNTTAGVLYGLWKVRTPASLKRVVLMGIGPDRQDWLSARMAVAGLPGPVHPDIELVHIPLHPLFATYGDRMPGKLDGITLHPTYEGKVVRFLNQAEPKWWTARDDKTCLWVVGGPLP